MKTLTEQEKQETLIISYNTHRNMIGMIGILLGPVLALSAIVIGNCNGLQMSISEYYFTEVSELFVGALYAVAFFLFGYHGFNFSEDPWWRRDRPFSIVAGIAAIGVASFPTTLDMHAPDCVCHAIEPITPYVPTLHFVSAGIFFGILAYFSLYLFRLGRNKESQSGICKPDAIYKWCGWIIIVCIILIGLYSKVIDHSSWEWTKQWPPIYFLETIALVAFGISWTTKGEFLPSVQGAIKEMKSKG